MSRHWNRAPFTVGIEISLDAGRWLDDDGEPIDGLPVPSGLPDETCAELILDCESTGYHDPGRMWPIEAAYPPEGEDEREVVAARLVMPGRHIVDFNPTLLDSLRERFAKRIESAEFSTSAD